MCPIWGTYAGMRAIGGFAANVTSALNLADERCSPTEAVMQGPKVFGGLPIIAEIQSPNGVGRFSTPMLHRRYDAETNGPPMGETGYNSLILVTWFQG